MVSNTSISAWQGKYLRSRKERRLACALVVICLVALMYRIILSGDGWYGAHHLRIDRLDSRLAELRSQLSENDEVTMRRLAQQRESLPANSIIAATRYYSWLHALAERHQWSEIKIDHTAPVVESGVGQRVTLTLHGKASIEHIGSLVDEFHSYGFLHGLTHLQIADYSPLSQEARAGLGLEFLSLENAPSDRPLELSGNGLADSQLRLGKSLSQQNPFRRFEPVRPVSVVPVETQQAVVIPAVDHLSQVKFVGLVQRDGQPQAWFYDALSHQELMLSSGSPLNIDQFQGQLSSIQQEQVVITCSHQSFAIELGQDLRTALERRQ